MRKTLLSKRETHLLRGLLNLVYLLMVAVFPRKAKIVSSSKSSASGSLYHMLVSHQFTVKDRLYLQ